MRQERVRSARPGNSHYRHARAIFLHEKGSLIYMAGPGPRANPTPATLLAIKSRRMRVAELCLKGHRTQRAIMAAYKASYGEPIGRGTVSRDLAAVREWWRQSAVEYIGQAIAEEIAKIDKVERSAWDAWERSIRNHEIRKASKLAKPAVDEYGDEFDKVRSKRLTIQTDDEIGDPRYLAIVERCIERRCKLLGLDAPQRQEIVLPGLHQPQTIDAVTPGQVKEQLRDDPEYIEFLRFRAARSDGIPWVDGQVAEPGRRLEVRPASSGS